MQFPCQWRRLCATMCGPLQLAFADLRVCAPPAPLATPATCACYGSCRMLMKRRRRRKRRSGRRRRQMLARRPTAQQQQQRTGRRRRKRRRRQTRRRSRQRKTGLRRCADAGQAAVEEMQGGATNSMQAQHSTAWHCATNHPQHQFGGNTKTASCGQLYLCAAGADTFPAALPCVVHARQKKKKKKKDA